MFRARGSQCGVYILKQNMLDSDFFVVVLVVAVFAALLLTRVAYPHIHRLRRIDI